MIHPISKEELIQHGAIYFDQINEGFEQYQYQYIEGSEEQVYQQLLNCLIENGLENSFVDFYYYRLTDQEKEKVESILSTDEIAYLSELEASQDKIYYPLNEKLLQITSKLTAHEMLFSTYYFTKEPKTVWGNYGRKYPVFTRNR